jgi:hypothetical protein
MADTRPAPKPKPKPALKKSPVVKDSNEYNDKKPAKKPKRNQKKDSGY